MINRISAVIFDMDGLMLDTERIARRAWKQAAREWGYDIPDTIYMQVLGRTVADTRRIFTAAFGEHFPFDDIRQRRLQIAREHHRQVGIPVKKGLLSLLDCLESLSLPLAVATSTVRQAAEQRLLVNNLLHRFRVIVTGDDISRGKPAPDIFLLAAQKLQTPAVQCLVLEDSEAGIEAAYAAGMLPVMVPDVKPPTETVRKFAYRVMTSLLDVEAWVKSHPSLFETSPVRK